MSSDVCEELSEELSEESIEMNPADGEIVKQTDDFESTW